MKRYENYKSSQYDWLGSIPKHWNEYRILRLCNLSCIQNNTNEGLLSVYLNRGVIKYNESTGKQVHKPSLDLSKYQLVEPGDFVLNNQQAWRGSVGVSTYRGIVSPAYIVLKVDKCYNSRYLNYLVRDSYCVDQYVLSSKGVGTIQRILDMDKFRNTLLILPPRAEQDQIVRYLDWKVSRINKLIHAYQREIKLLEERKLVVINNAVTKGLDPNVEMKDSGVSWIGEIPKGWEVDKVKKYFKIIKKIAGSEGYDVLSITQQGLKIKNIESNEGQMAKDYSGYQFVKPGQFAMNHMDLLTGYIGLAEQFGVTSPDYRVFQIENNDVCYDKYYLIVFQIGYKRKILYGFGKGAANKGRWRMPATAFYNYDIPLPPLSEQQAIVRYLDAKCAQIETLKSKTQRKIELLTEYRTRLISDVVTGQIDVRDVVIPNYEVEEEVIEADDDVNGEEVCDGDEC